MKVARTWGYVDGIITWEKNDPVQLDLYYGNSYICFDCFFFFMGCACQLVDG